MAGLSFCGRTASDYQIGIICALPVEQAAMLLMLDEEHPKTPKAKDDENDYALGRIGVHNVAIASLPAGLVGNNPAAIVATNMKRSFPIQFGLLVGVGGGVWSRKHDIRLGDVVVSQPEGQHGGVVQWDSGKTQRGGDFFRTGSLNKPPKNLLNALQTLQTRHWREDSKITEILSSIHRNPRLAQSFAFPGTEHDRLFEASYEHVGEDDYDGCDDCDAKRAMPRSKERSAPAIHYGIIASGNQVIKHGPTRDKIAKGLQAICFEMEAAGLDDFSCLVIRGICDYADTHKNKKWQPYAAIVAAAFAKEFLDFVDKQEVTVAKLTETKHFLVPFDRNKKFVGRKEFVPAVIQALCIDDSDQSCQRIAIFGLGGVGKTQVAIEVAFRIRSLNPSCSIFWVPATDTANFEKAYHEIGRLVRIPGIDDEKANVKLLVREYLSRSSSRWLLIIDNADDKNLLFAPLDKDGRSHGLAIWLPRSRKGAILFTTRTLNTAVDICPGDSILTLSQMDQDEAVQMLETCLRIASSKEACIQLQQILFGLPLAMKQATAYINRFEMTISTYIEIYQNSDRDSITLLSENFEDVSRYSHTRNPIVATWLISFQHIISSNPLAADYLSYIGCLAEYGFPKGFFPIPSEREFTEAIGTLKGYAFLTEEREPGVYFIHRLVQLATSNWLQTQGTLQVWHKKSIAQMCIVFPVFRHETRYASVPYVPHALFVIDSLEDTKGIEVDLSNLLCSVASFLEPIGKYQEAETLLQRLVQLRLSILGEQDPLTLDSIDNLAVVLRRQGKYMEAEEKHRQALEGNRKERGNEHPSTLDSIDRLGIVLRRQGKYEEAEEMHDQALKGRRKILGYEHPSALDSMNNLALVLHEQGRFEESETIHRQVLKGKRKICGHDHPSTLDSMNNLALVLDEQGKYGESKEIYHLTLEAKQKILGHEHPSTFDTMNNLASLLDLQGEYTDSEEMHRQVLRGRQQIIGYEHPSTLDSMNNLALVLEQQGKYEEAEDVHRQALKGKRKVLSHDHPSTLDSIDNLALVLRSQGKYAEAEVMHRKVLEGTRKALGEEHPSTLDSMNNLALVLLEQGRFKEAEDMNRQALKGNRKARGDEHPSTLESMNNLASVLAKQGAYGEAEQMCQDALRGRHKMLGEMHPGSIECERNLTSIRSARIARTGMDEDNEDKCE